MNLYTWVERENWDWNGAKDPTSSSVDLVIDQSALETKSTILVEAKISESFIILDSSIILTFQENRKMDDKGQRHNEGFTGPGIIRLLDLY